MSSEFEVVFYGQVLAGKDVGEVRENLRRMFKADDAKLNALFSGKKVVIKSGLDTVTADKYLQALTKAGAQAEKIELNKPPVAKNPAQFAAKDFAKPSLSSVAEAHSERKAQEHSGVREDERSREVPVQPPVTEVPEDEARRIMEEFRQKEAKLSNGDARTVSSTEVESKQKTQSLNADDLTIAPVGDLIPSIPGPEDVEVPDLGHLTVKPMEGYLVDPEPEEEVKVPDTSHLKIED